eukprot:scaffold8842_cov130-Skeletonema_marinoi.AAC.1
MKAHPDLNRVHEIGCDVIRLLSLGRNDDNYRLLGENGAYTVVVRSMWSHSQNIAIQERAVEALAVLSEHSNNVPVILDAGGIEAVLAAMHTFAESPHVQIKGCAMLSNFASAVDSIKVKIVDEGALDVIVMAMVLHSDNEEIQVRAVILLRKLCIKENVQRMITANISPVITVVEETLGDKLHEETSYIEALKLGRKEGWAKDGYGYRKEGKGKMLSVRKPELKTRSTYCKTLFREAESHALPDLNRWGFLSLATHFCL